MPAVMEPPRVAGAQVAPPFLDYIALPRRRTDPVEVPPPFWSLDASADTARQLWEYVIGRPLPHWDRVVNGWRQAKQRLINLIDPLTGRLLIPLDDVLPTPKDQHEKLGQLLAATYHNDFSSRLSPDEVAADAVAPNSQLLIWKTYFKPGQKISRALAAHFEAVWGKYVMADRFPQAACVLNVLERWHKNNEKKDRERRDPTNAEFIALYVGDLWERLQRTGGTLVLSANLLDILTLSENAPFTSCLTLTGDYRCGPLMYSQDGFTATCYLSQEDRPWRQTKHILPYKVWRQHVHFDFVNKGAYFANPYGNGLPAGVHKKLRQTVAELLTRSCELPTGDFESLWNDETDRDLTHPVNGGSSPHASIDGCYGKGHVLWAKSGWKPSFKTATNLPCARCATGTIRFSRPLICC